MFSELILHKHLCRHISSNIFWYLCTGCEGKVAKVLSKTEEDQLQPFKDNMENFLKQANLDFEDTEEKLQKSVQR